MSLESLRIRFGCSCGLEASVVRGEKKSTERDSLSASAGRVSSASKMSSSNVTNFSRGTVRIRLSEDQKLIWKQVSPRLSLSPVRFAEDLPASVMLRLVFPGR